MIMSIVLNTASMEGVVRNENGELIKAFSKDLNLCSINCTIVEATYYAMNWCDIGKKVILEMKNYNLS